MEIYCTKKMLTKNPKSSKRDNRHIEIEFNCQMLLIDFTQALSLCVQHIQHIFSYTLHTRLTYFHSFTQSSFSIDFLNIHSLFARSPAKETCASFAHCQNLNKSPLIHQSLQFLAGY